jgi:hypothetical protein
MPRSSSSSRSSSSKIHVAPPYTVAPYRAPYGSIAPTPSTGPTFKESLVSGVGSGIGFGVGSRIVSGLFGAPVVAVEKVGSAVSETKSAVNTFAQTTIPNLQQCKQNAIQDLEKPLCYTLLSNDPRHHEFKQCMETSDNQIHMCKEFLPKE